jgi:hypothetical protein
MHHQLQICSSKGVFGWQVEALILPTTLPAKVPLLHVGQTVFYLMGQSQSLHSAPRGRGEGSSTRSRQRNSNQ